MRSSDASSAEADVERFGATHVLTVDTPGGPGRLYVYPAATAGATLVLGHGAGGGIGAVDLQATAAAATAAGWSVVLMEQPWRVAGRKVATAPPTLDRAFSAAVQALRSTLGDLGPLVLGGRSAGARVACRTAAELEADGVVCLAFPLHPPGRPEKSRIEELAPLAQGGLPTLVVQGARDAFGSAAEVRSALTALPIAGLADGSPTVVVEVPGDHGLKADPDAVAAAVVQWLVKECS